MSTNPSHAGSPGALGMQLSAGLELACETREGRIDCTGREIGLQGRLGAIQDAKLREIPCNYLAHCTRHSEVWIPTRLKISGT